MNSEFVGEVEGGNGRAPRRLLVLGFAGWMFTSAVLLAGVRYFEWPAELGTALRVTFLFSLGVPLAVLIDRRLIKVTRAWYLGLAALPMVLLGLYALGITLRPPVGDQGLGAMVVMAVLFFIAWTLLPAALINTAAETWGAGRTSGVLLLLAPILASGVLATSAVPGRCVTSDTNCVCTIALERNDLLLCRRAGKPDVCVYNFAHRRQQPELCRHLADRHFKDQCFLYVSMKAPRADICSEIEGTEEKSACFFNLAVASGESSYCLQTQPADRCLSRLRDHPGVRSTP